MIHRPLGTRGRVLRDHPQKLCAYSTACSCGYRSPEVSTVEVARSFLSDHLTEAKRANRSNSASSTDREALPSPPLSVLDGGLESVREATDSSPSI